MPQWRKLHTKVTESLDFNEMPDDFTRLVWVLLPLGLDREGRSLDNASLVKARLMPLRDDVSSAQVAAALDWYARRGMIVRYQVSGHRYFYVPTFRHYQGNTSREAESTYPEPLSQECASQSRPTHDLLTTNSSTDVDVDVDVEEKREEKSADAAPDGAPRTFPDWQERLKSSKNKAAVLAEMHAALYPSNELPDYGYLGKVARQLGGAGRLADLLWQHSTRPPTGDVLAFLVRVATSKDRGNGRDSPRAGPVVIERKVADIPKGWLQEPFDPDEEPQL